MGRRRRRRDVARAAWLAASSALAALFALLVAACSLVTDLSGLTGGGAASDGAAGAADGASSDAAGGGDATIADGGGDGGSSPCRTGVAHDLCADFDRSADVGEGFTAVEVNGATMAFVDGVFRSAPHAAVAIVPPAPNDNVGAVLVKSILKDGTSLHCELDVLRRQQGSRDGSFAILSLELRGADGSSFELEVKQTEGLHYHYQATQHTDGGQTALNDLTAFAPPAVGTWAHLVYDVDLTTQRLRGSVDGKTALDRSWPLPARLTRAIVRVGMDVVTPNLDAWSFAFDDVVCDVRP